MDDSSRSVRRAPHIFLQLRDDHSVDVLALLQQKVLLRTEPLIELIAPMTGMPRLSSRKEIALLSEIPVDQFIPVDALLQKFGLTLQRVDRLVKDGILLEEGSLAESWWAARESIAWHPAAQLFHACSLFESAESKEPLATDLEAMRANAQERLDQRVEAFGPPPMTWVRYDSASTAVQLPEPLADEEDPFFKTLRSRRTSRHFRETPVELERFSNLLSYSFGVQATVQLGLIEGRDPHVVALKSSPSGGASHAIEAFPLIAGVEGVTPGVYHYDSASHSLSPLLQAPVDEVRGLLIRLSEGQQFVGSAAAAVLLVARLSRNYWKYRKRSRTYAVVHQDAGHLSQTFYMVATRLGLGAFYTAAISGAVARDDLGIDDSTELAIGICGCGIPSAEADSWLPIRKFQPGVSELVGGVELRPVVRTDASEPSEGDEALLGRRSFRTIRITPKL